MSSTLAKPAATLSGELSLRALGGALAERSAGPGRGTVAAACAAVAAGLAEGSRQVVSPRATADQRERAAALATRLEELRAVALALLERDVRAHHEVAEAYRHPHDGGGSRMDAALGEALEAPLASAAAALEIGELARELADVTAARLRGDALAAAALASTSAEIALDAARAGLEHADGGRRAAAAALFTRSAALRRACALPGGPGHAR